MRVRKPKTLFRKLNIPEHIFAFMSEDEQLHAEAALRSRREARAWITQYQFDKTQHGKGFGYNAEYWQCHSQMNEADAQLKGLRAVLRLRYSLTFEEGLYVNSRGGTWGRFRTGLFGRSRGRYLKKGTLLMWIERDEFGENWFMNLSDNRTILAVKGAALQNVIPVPPEEDDT